MSQKVGFWRYVIWFPGYLIIFIQYFFPTEWGEGRNTAKSSRWWVHKDKMAPLLSIVAYAVIFLVSDPSLWKKEILGEEVLTSQQKILIQKWYESEDDCRGRIPDDPLQEIGCKTRQELGLKLQQSGLCYGRRGQAGYQMTWHVCSSDSER